MPSNWDKWHLLHKTSRFPAKDWLTWRSTQPRQQRMKRTLKLLLRMLWIPRLEIQMRLLFTCDPFNSQIPCVPEELARSQTDLIYRGTSCCNLSLWQSPLWIRLMAVSFKRGLNQTKTQSLKCRKEVRMLEIRLSLWPFQRTWWRLKSNMEPLLSRMPLLLKLWILQLFNRLFKRKEEREVKENMPERVLINELQLARKVLPVTPWTEVLAGSQPSKSVTRSCLDQLIDLLAPTEECSCTSSSETTSQLVPCTQLQTRIWNRTKLLLRKWVISHLLSSIPS